MRSRLLHLAAIVVLLAALPRLAVAQQSGASPAPPDSDKNLAEPRTRADQTVAPKRYYKLDFVLREADEGKVINQRSFTMNVSADEPQNRNPTWWNLRSGTRVPVPNMKGDAAITYVDVGVNLDLRAFDRTNGLEMEITSEISSAGTAGGNMAPPIRQVKVKSAVLAPIGKPTVVFTADDPASKHQFELQVTPVLQK